MGKKKPFINKKNSATFQLLARDSASGDGAISGESPATDRVFVRVDNNPYSVRGIEEDVDDELNEELGANSIFADAPEDADDEKCEARDALPHHVRREIVELGLPDDGYNYLNHLREIKMLGGGSTFYQNSKAKLDQLPLDVKAFDASRLRISDVSSELNDDSKLFNKVASKTVGVKVQRAVDPDVARLLEDSDLSRVGSDVEDLDEDFMVKANLPDGEEEEEEVVRGKSYAHFVRDTFLEEDDKFADCEGDDEFEVSDKPRVCRLLDEQFDLLTLREYDTDSGYEDAGYMGTEDGPLAAKIGDTLKPYVMDNFELGHKYRAPGDLDHDLQGSDVGAELDLSTDIIQKCVEYAEKYCNESQDDEEVVLVEESSDESEVWDCETIVSTYSNLDNHPGKIQAPQNLKKRISKNFPGDSITKDNVITLRGKEKLPVEFLPPNKKTVERVKAGVKPSSGTDNQKRRPHGEESKEEKKERKVAVKKERREARQAKKELKVLYRCEAQKAQKAAAVAGPSSVHLM